MRASGVSLRAISRPILFGAVLLAAFVAWVNECHMPAHALAAKRLRTARFRAAEAMREGAPTYKDSRRHHSWVVAGDHDASCRHLTDVRITLEDPEEGRERVVSAERADWLDGEWWLTGAKTIHYVSDPSADADMAFRTVPSPTPALDALPFRAMPELRERPSDLQMQSAGAQFISSRAKLRYLRTSRDMTDESRRDLMYDAWAQILSPFACIVITLLSIPAGMTSGRQSVFAGVLGALGLFFAYYGLVIACLVMAKTGIMPPVPAAFLPPVAFTAVGVYFCYRPLKPTLILAAAIFVLTAIYAALAELLAGKLGIDRPMAQSLAATPPVLAALALVFMPVPPAWRRV